DWEHLCLFRSEAAENLYKSVDEKSDPQVARGHAYLAQLKASIATWRADGKRAQDNADKAQRVEHDTDTAARNASELIGWLTDARTGKRHQPLLSCETRAAA